jgi:farnesyl-diphosphate farnesyltransferase
MNDTATRELDAMTILEQTSRTFYIPISRLPPDLREATTSAYLCLRAIDEIEDHPDLPAEEKSQLLVSVSQALQAFSYEHGADVNDLLDGVIRPYRATLAPVSARLGDWINHAPTAIAPRIIGDTASMADRMAFWAHRRWRVDSRNDLDSYCYAMAAAVGLLMCDISAWYDRTQLDRSAAIFFGRGLQLTNIARNRGEDLQRGVDFYPPGWSDADLREYARHWLRQTSLRTEAMPEANVSYFIKIPLALAEATLTALERGETKLTREAVISIVGV